MRITVRVYPGSRRNEVGGSYGVAPDQALMVRVTAPAVEGQANDAVIRAVAKAFAVRVSAVSLINGSKNRTKLIEIEGLDPQLLERFLSL